MQRRRLGVFYLSLPFFSLHTLLFFEFLLKILSLSLKLTTWAQLHGRQVPWSASLLSLPWSLAREARAQLLCKCSTWALLLSQHSLTHGAILPSSTVLSLSPRAHGNLYCSSVCSLCFPGFTCIDLSALEDLILLLSQHLSLVVPSGENFLLSLLRSIFLHPVFNWNTSYSEIPSLAMLAKHWLTAPWNQCIPLCHIPCLLSSKGLKILWNHCLICWLTQIHCYVFTIWNIAWHKGYSICWVHFYKETYIIKYVTC